MSESFERHGSKRWSAQYKRTNERELYICKRIARALRRHGFNVEDVTKLDRYGVRCSAEHLRVCKGGLCWNFAVVLPGHKPDEMQREGSAVIVGTPSEALRVVSLGVLA